jgi:hypothetical protein
VNGAWFCNVNAHGVKYSRYFTSHLPLPAFALVLTVVSYCFIACSTVLTSTSFQIEFVLEEWQTGEEKRLVFSEAEYKMKFERHLVTLKKWRDEIPEGMEEICKDLIDNAR